MGAGLADQALTPPPAALVQRWRHLAARPGLPDHWELDEYGEVVETIPPGGPHQRVVTALLVQSLEQLGGDALPGAGVVTRIGVHVPDVCWNPEPHTEDPVVPATRARNSTRSSLRTSRPARAR